MNPSLTSPQVNSRTAPRILAVVVILGLLAVDPGGWHVFGPVKWLILTAGTWLAAAAALGSGTTLHRASIVGWGIFLVWCALTAGMALDPLSAWLGTPDRRLGVVGLATLAAAYLAGQAVNDPPARRLFAHGSVVALGGMGLYGMAEAVGWTPELTITTSRLGSTLGSPAYLGASLCLLVPIAVAIAADRGEAGHWRLAAAAASGGGLLLLAGSGTRAALVGIGVAVAFTVTLWWPRVRRRRVTAAAAVVLGVALLLLVPQGRRLMQPDLGGRMAEWETAASVLAERPIFGTGPEGYRVAFPRHVQAGYVQRYGRSTVTDRAHSGPLDMGVATGLPGMAAWVAGAGWLVWSAGRVLRPGDPVLAGLAAGAVGVFAQELFLFPTLEVGVAGWAVAGAVVAARPDTHTVEARSRVPTGAATVLAVVALAAGAAGVIADHLAASARATGNVAEADRAATLRPDSYRYPLLAADLALRDGFPSVAAAHLENATDLAPDDPALRQARARVTLALVEDGSVSAAVGADAVGALVRDDPNHPQLRLIHGALQARAGEAERAERAWLAAGHLAPRSAEAHLRLASLYQSVGEPELAREALETAHRREPEHPGISDLEEELADA